MVPETPDFTLETPHDITDWVGLIFVPLGYDRLIEVLIEPDPFNFTFKSFVNYFLTYIFFDGELLSRFFLLSVEVEKIPL